MESLGLWGVLALDGVVGCVDKLTERAREPASFFLSLVSIFLFFLFSSSQADCMESLVGYETYAFMDVM